MLGRQSQQVPSLGTPLDYGWSSCCFTCTELAEERRQTDSVGLRAA